jgi:hypothetical protein
MEPAGRAAIIRQRLNLAPLAEDLVARGDLSRRLS